MSLQYSVTRNKKGYLRKTTMVLAGTRGSPNWSLRHSNLTNKTLCGLTWR